MRFSLAEARSCTRLAEAEVAQLFGVTLAGPGDPVEVPEDDYALMPCEAAALWLCHLLNDVQLGTPATRAILLHGAWPSLRALAEELARTDLSHNADDGPLAGWWIAIEDRRYAAHKGMASGHVLDLETGRVVPAPRRAAIEFISYNVSALYRRNARSLAARRPAPAGDEGGPDVADR